MHWVHRRHGPVSVYIGYIEGMCVHWVHRRHGVYIGCKGLCNNSAGVCRGKQSVFA